MWLCACNVTTSTDLYAITTVINGQVIIPRMNLLSTHLHITHNDRMREQLNNVQKNEIDSTS